MASIATMHARQPRGQVEYAKGMGKRMPDQRLAQTFGRQQRAIEIFD
jgi:hypothetical protein